MTTLHIDDELSALAQQAAVAHGMSLQEFVDEVLRDAVRGVSTRRTVRNGLPVMQLNPPTPIDPGVVQRVMQEDGF